MFRKYILDNPEFIRHCRTAFRKQKLISMTNIYFVALFVFYALVYLSMLNPNKPFSVIDYSKALYVINMGIIYVAYFYIGSYLTANSLAAEKERGTFDFLRMTTIERKVLAIGKLFGGSIFLSYLIALNMITILIFAYLGQISVYHFFMVNVNLIVYGLMFHTISLFAAVSSKKVSSANSLSLAIPLFYTMISLSLPGRSSNPFYALFAPLSSRISTDENLSFFGVYLPAYLIIASMIICLIYWLMKGIIRKLDSESNHLFTRTEGIKIFFIIQFFFTGFIFNSLYKGEELVVVGYFYFFLIVNTFISVLLSPSREDSIIFINKQEQLTGLKKFLDSKSSSFGLLAIFNFFTLVIAIFYSIIIIYSGKPFTYPLIAYFSLVTFLFSFIYNQIFYYFSFTSPKNSITLSSVVILLSMFVPIPLFGFNLDGMKDTFNMFLLNPLSAMVVLDLDTSHYFGFRNLSQLLVIIIVALILNYLIKSKKAEIIRKFKIQS